ncbi:unnamed protein product [Clavelina lepadiformis]|uniref:Ral guanine nucleotide dissociation stimulator-like 1 n=1 Tax=Clavelina lepadiformis TaxID=159417 RepID=A0ABP0FA25_CLALP
MVMMSSISTSLINGYVAPDYGIDNKREWGEERHDDVIYAVMLKRIRRAPSPSHIMSDGLQWETHKVRYIKGATLQHLVSHLCQSFIDDWGEKNFLTVFLATYRSFATPEAVLDQIVKEGERLKSEPSEKSGPIYRSIEQVLRTWLERYFGDFYDPPHHHLLKKMRALAEEYKQSGVSSGSSVILAPDSETCDFLTYLNTKLQAAEVRSSQESAVEAMNTPCRSPMLPVEINGFALDEEFLNLDSARTMFQQMSVQNIAEQLTVKDANLFLRVVPHHCLTAVRSCKEKPACVRATIDQFNKVVYCVLGTCLCPALKLSQRVKVFCKWIEVAQVCRELKNFSSLRAIVSGLQTHSIHRLKRTWQHVPSYHMELLQELEQINMKDLIMKVGTAKVNTDTSAISRVRKDATFRRQRDILSGVMHGTVPYLGSFLTDLTYLHTAKPDFLEKGLINFNKRRNEFELLAQLQLWQASCRSYQHLESDTSFNEWFNSIMLPTDEQAVQLSEKIEIPNSMPVSPTPSTPLKKTISDMLAFHGGAYDWNGNGAPTTSVPVNLSRHSSNESSKSDSHHPPVKTNGQVMNTETSSNEGRVVQIQLIKKRSDDDTFSPEHKTKEINLSSNDRSPAFIKKAFELFDLTQEDLHNFSLMQLLPGDKELVIPGNGNVYYAMNSSMKEYNFALVEDGAEVPKEKRTQTLPRPSSGQKSKKLNRKAVSTSSMSVKPATTSPMKSIYRHIALGGLSSSSASYSPAKEINRQGSLQDEDGDIHEFHLPDDKILRCSAQDDSILYSKSPPSEHSGYESDGSSWSQKLKKLVASEKRHRRNFSDTARVRQDVLDMMDVKQRAKSKYERSNSIMTLPAKMTAPMFSISSSTTPSEESKHWSSESHSSSSDEDNSPADEFQRSWPRKRTVPVSTQRVRLNRRSAFRKAQPPARVTGFYRHLSEQETENPPTHNAPYMVTRSESRSKFYVDYATKSLEKQSSVSSVTSMDPIHESDGDEILAGRRKSIFTRTRSDSCILEAQTFGAVREDSIVVPTITVHSPSPKRTSDSNKWEAEPDERRRESSRSSSTTSSESITTHL